MWGDELEAFSLEQAAEVGTLLFGRRTHEGMAAHWSKETGPIADFMNSVEKVVASRTPKEPGWTNARLLDGDLAAAVEALKHEQGGDIYVFGSGELAGQLMRENLIDEIRLCLAPVTLGGQAPVSSGPAGAVHVKRMPAASDGRRDPVLQGRRLAAVELGPPGGGLVGAAT